MGRTFRKDSPYRSHPKRDRELERQRKHIKKYTKKTNPKKLKKMHDYIGDDENEYYI